MNRSLTRLVRFVSASAFVLVSGLTSQAQADLLFSDNFDVADTTNFDGASLAGRLGGSLGGDIKLASALTQQAISGNQLLLVSTNPVLTSGSVKFIKQSDSTNYDWAAGTEGADILSAGGVRIEFDWTRSNTALDHWVSFSTGFTYSTEPNFRIVDAGTDFGILLRNSGIDTQKFDNGTGAATGSFTATDDPQHVTINLLFSSYADGQSVSAITTVGSTVVDSSSFTWNGNSGQFFFELSTVEAGQKIDNLSVSTVPEPSSLALLVLGGLLISQRRRG